MGGVQGVVPFAVERVSGDRGGGLHLLVTDLDAGGVGVGVEGGGHYQAGAGGGRTGQVDDGLVAGLYSPIEPYDQGMLNVGGWESRVLGGSTVTGRTGLPSLSTGHRIGVLEENAASVQ